MSPKRRGYWVYVGTDAANAPPKKKAATGSSRGKVAAKPAPATAALRRKGKSSVPDWTKRPEWSHDKPTGEWARKCVDRWCLLAPYDTRITEDQWKEYYQERFELDEVNTLKGDKSGPVVSEDLAQNTWEILRRSGEDVAAAILGSKLDDGERKNRIVYTLVGSLYFLSLMGQDEGDILPSPRNIDAQTRLYSPFGIGTSVDFHYSYHYRMRYGSDDRISSLDAAARSIAHCDAKNPRNCAADPDEEAEPITPVVAFNIFERSDEASVTIPESAITGFEESLLGCKGWLSPMKIADMLLAAGAVMHCHEQDVETPQSFPKRLAYFPGENKGKREMGKVVSKIAKLEIGDFSEFIANQDEFMERPICIPQRCLGLARQVDGSNAASTSSANA